MCLGITLLVAIRLLLMKFLSLNFFDISFTYCRCLVPNFYSLLLFFIICSFFYNTFILHSSHPMDILVTFIKYNKMEKFFNLWKSVGI